MGRVLILREQRAAERTAAELREIGYQPIILPVQTIRPLEPAEAMPEKPAALLVSSPAAVPFASKAVPTSTPVLAVGPRTAQAAREAGFADVETADASGAGLGELAAARAKTAGGELLYLAGRVRSRDLEEYLEESGVAVRTIEVYDTVMLYPTGEEIEAALGDRTPEAALVLSVGQAKGLLRIIETRPDLFLPTLRILCLSERIAAAVPDEIDGTVFVAARPEPAALYELL